MHQTSRSSQVHAHQEIQAVRATGEDTGGIQTSPELCPCAAPTTGKKGRTTLPQTTPAAVTQGQENFQHLQPSVLDHTARLPRLQAPVCPCISPQMDSGAGGFWGAASGQCPTLRAFVSTLVCAGGVLRCGRGTGSHEHRTSIYRGSFHSLCSTLPSLKISTSFV